MITTKTRVLSFLATVAMLVSMVACFVIPASAADDAVAMYTAIYNDAESGADALKAALDSNADATALAEAATGITFKADAKPRYAWKDAYAAAGYNAKVYGISTPDDWKAMIAGATSSPYYVGYEFHLLNDVDFKDAGTIGMMGYSPSTGSNNWTMTPYYFGGTLDGHNFMMKNMTVSGNADGERNMALIAGLDVTAVVKNIGFSGTITHTYSDGSGYRYNTTCSLFYATKTGSAEQHAKVSRVWNDMDLVVTKTQANASGVAASISGLFGYAGNGSGFFEVNGYLFTGSLTRPAGADPWNSNSLNGDSSPNGHIYNAVVDATADTFFQNKCDAYGDATASNHKNIFGKGFTKPFGCPRHEDSYDSASNGAYKAATYEMDSAEDGAYKVNIAQNDEQGFEKVYFTKVNGELRPIGTADNMLVKATVTGAKDAPQTIYLNLNEEYSLEAFAAMVDVDANAIAAINGAAADTVKVTADGETIAVSIDTEGLLAEAIAKYADLNADYFDADSKAALEAFRAAPAKVEAGEMSVTEALALEPTELKITTDYKNLPQYKEFAKYSKYNAANNWLIKEPADWLAMIAVKSGFAGYEFHVANDIDFNNEKMAPLGVGIEFKATIEGHGHAFKNINVEYTSSAGSQSIGLICWLSAPAKISNFGVDSGLIRLINNNNHFVGTFSGKVTGAVQLNNVWAGAKLHSDGGSSYLMGILGGALADTGAVINGAYFFGAMQVNFSNNANSFSIAGENARGIKAYNTLTAPYDPNGIDAIAKLHKGNNNDWINNAYANVGSVFAAAPFQFTGDSGGAVNGDQSVGTIAADSAIDGAHKLNLAQATSTAPSKTYFTLNANGDIRPTSDATNMIVKYTVTGDVEKTGYINAGEIKLVDDLGIFVGEGSTITMGETAVDGETINVTNDFTLSVTYSDELKTANALAAIAEEEAKYEGLDVNHFKTTASEGKITLAQWQAMVADAKGEEGSLAKLEAAANAIATIEIVLAEELSKLPGYADYAAYKNYNAGNNWAIRTPADWLAMVAESKADTTITYEGYNFHLVGDVDFGGVAMAPLCYGGAFRGNIDGHGYGFSNVLIDKTTITLMTTSVGLICKMTNGTVQNFGINSGAIDASEVNDNAYNYVGGLFGIVSCSVATDAINITRCWNGADVDTFDHSKQASGAALAGCITSNENGTKNIIINGFLNTGDVTNHSTFSGELYVGVISSGSACHTLGGVFNSLNTGAITGVAAPDATVNPGKGATFMRLNLGQSCHAKNNASTGSLLFFHYGDPADLASVFTYSNGYASAEEAAYAVNKGNTDLTNAYSSAIDPVYYTIVNGQVRPTGTVDNQIIKVTMEGDETAVAYVNAGTIKLADLGVYTGEGSSFAIGGEAIEGATFTASDDVTLVVTYETIAKIAIAEAELATYTEKYNKYDANLMANDTLAAFYEAVSAIGGTEGEERLGAINAAISAGKAVTLALRTDGYPNYPQFKDYDLYKDLNTTNNWLIKEAADWKAMMAAATATAGDTYFAGYTFHLVEDVDFASAGKLAPMGLAKYFGGTINGHGYGFSNLTIVANDIVPNNNSVDEYMADSYPGLFYRMGNCVLQDFGVNSGSFKVTYGGAGTSITTFGYFKGKKPQLNRVWFGADLTKGSGTHTISVLGHECHDNGAIFNGFYFYGATNAANTIIGGSNSRGNKFFNIIAAPTNVKAADNVLKAFRTDLLINGNTNTTVYDKVENVYGVGYTTAFGYRENEDTTKDEAGNKIPYPDNDIALDSEIALGDNARLLAPSAEEAAFLINTNPSTNATPVYYSYVNGNIRPVADATNMIVKVTLGGDVESATRYFNKGTELNLEDLGIAVGQGTEITVNGVAHDSATVTLTENTTAINVTYTSDVAMAEAIAKFDKLDPIHLSNGNALTKIREDAAAATTNAEMQAVIAACESFIPAVTTDYTKLPAYSDYEIYKAYNAGNNWMIATAADWLKMVAESKEDTSITYQGYNFHLTNDVDFNNVAMAPLCYGGVFRGNIDGHGYGFSNVLIDETTITLMTTSVGLICKMTNGTIQNFGINSGAIDASEVDDNSYNYVGGLFGIVSCSVDTDAINITRCWNGADVDTFGHSMQASGAALAGLVTSNENGTKNIIINGFLNTGDVTNHSTFSGELYVGVISSGSACHTLGGVFNSLNTGAITGVAAPDATVNPGKGATFMRLNLGMNCHAKNNASTGSLLFFHYGDPADLASVFTYSNGYASAEEAAYAVNKGNTGLTNANSVAIDPVYYTIIDGQVRPTGTADNQIRKIIIENANGEVIETLYAAPGEVALNVMGITGYTVKTGAASSVNGTTLTLGNEDVVLTGTLCEHTNKTAPAHIDGTKTHKVECTACDWFEITDCSGTKVAGAVAEDGTSFHSMTCSVCSHAYDNFETCNGTLVKDATNCTKDHKWTFACGVHKAEYTIEGSGNATHVFEGNWIADGDKEFRKCAHCETKEYRTIGKVSASADATVSASCETTVIVTLDTALKTGTITLSASEGFTITKVVPSVEGSVVWQSGQVYAANNAAAGTTLTVTLKAASTVEGNGTLTVSITGATDADGIVTDATASATITYQALVGDANADGKVNVIDALKVLYHTTDKENYPVHGVNADADGDGDITPADAYFIVREWLKTL